MKVQNSSHERKKDSIIRSLEYLDEEKVRFLNSVAIALVNKPVEVVKSMIKDI